MSQQSTQIQFPGMLADDAQKLQRRRALMETMMAQAGGGQGRMVGGHYIRGSNPLTGLVSLAGGYLLGRDQDKLESQARTRYQEDLAKGLQGYFDRRDGRPGEVMNDQQAEALMRDDVAPTLAEPVKADPRQAVIEALSSQHPMIQQLGAQDLARMGPKQLDPRFIKEHEGQFYDLSSGTPKLLGGAAYGPTEVIGGDLYQRSPSGKLVKLDNAPKVTTTIHNAPTNAGAKAYLEAVGKGIGPGGEGRKDAEAARTGLRSSVEALTAINDGARMGIAEPALQVARKLAAQAGFAQAETAPTETLAMVLKKSVFDDLGGLGAQISDGDRSFVEGFTGTLMTDPAAMKRILALRIAGQMQRQNEYNQQVDAFAQRTEDPMVAQEARRDLAVTIPDNDVAAMVSNILSGRESTTGLPHMQTQRRPGAPGMPAAGGQPIPLEQYLQQLRGGR